MFGGRRDYGRAGQRCCFQRDTASRQRKSKRGFDNTLNQADRLANSARWTESNFKYLVIASDAEFAPLRESA